MDVEIYKCDGIGGGPFTLCWPLAQVVGSCEGKDDSEEFKTWRERESEWGD